MAAWDALARAHELPLVELLGGSKKQIPAYGSLRTMHRESVVEEARELAEMGFEAYKVKIGHGDVRADLEAHLRPARRNRRRCEARGGLQPVTVGDGSFGAGAHSRRRGSVLDRGAYPG
jgi:L-alanine-DL-glutamate epimerase-like enolase superfamily enzyme